MTAEYLAKLNPDQRRAVEHGFGATGDDLRPLLLEQRKEHLRNLLSRFNEYRLKLSESFNDGEKLLVAAAEMNLEGIISKKRTAPYIAGVGRLGEGKDAGVARGKPRALQTVREGLGKIEEV